MLLPVQICRHFSVSWQDAHTCRCTDCGRTGRWYEEGYVLWCRRPAAPPSGQRLPGGRRLRLTAMAKVTKVNGITNPTIAMLKVP